MIEIEKTYLVKYLPEKLFDCHKKEIIDIYIPKEINHPKLRLRKNGDKYEMTKKSLTQEGDASHQNEETIVLEKNEFDALSEIQGKRVSKMRYYYPYNGNMAEVDVFNSDLAGLVLVDFEFSSLEERDVFEMPDFCLVEVTQEEFIAGGMLCGKSYVDIEKELESFKYVKL